MIWFIPALISAIFSAASAITQKKVLFSESPLEFSLKISIVNLVWVIPLICFTDVTDVTTEIVLVLFIKSLLASFAFLSVMTSIKRMEISGALPLLVLTPAIVAVLSYIFLDDGLSANEIVGMVILLVGIYVLESGSAKSLTDPFKMLVNNKDIKYIVIALFLFAISTVMDKWLLSDYKVSPNKFIIYNQFFNLSIFYATYVITYKKFTTNVTGVNLKWLVAIALFTFAYRYTQIYATKMGPAALVLAVKRTSVLFAVVGGGKLFKESNIAYKAAGAVILIIGAFIILYKF